jgi:hypothetical protein
MSELITTSARAHTRLQLLGTASALALLVAASTAKAEDTDRPTVWIELGGQLARMDGGEQQFVPPFIVKTPRPAPETISPLSVGHPPRHSFDGEGKLTFAPKDTNWVFSAAARFGRSTAAKHLHQQSYPTGDSYRYRYALPFSDVERKGSESHVVLDFQAGKDVGVGMFGHDSMSVFSLGVRFAQFGSKSNTALKSQPDFHKGYKYIGTAKLTNAFLYHDNLATEAATRSFHGIGPSLSWNASAPLAGNVDDGEIAFDWGVNGAVLFGRQKASVHHQTTQFYKNKGANYAPAPITVYRYTPPDKARSHSVTVPNIGGFAGLSFKYPNAKLSIGYRADFFFNAMDGGIDTRKTIDRNFYGPFATVSIGLGG